jgi:hypothetical protein
MRFFPCVLIAALVGCAAHTEKTTAFSRTPTSFESATQTATFKGPITVRGVLYFTFDMASETRMAGVLFAKFVPDPDMHARLPAAVSGHFAAPVRHVSFEPADNVLERTVSASEAARVSHGFERIITVPVEIVIDDYRASVECDSRVYSARLLSVRSLAPQQVASAQESPHGC